MSAKGPIILIDDDEDDQFLIKNVLEELEVPNKLIIFQNGLEALHYLQHTADQPFLIFCDVNMPVMNGLELRDRIEQNEYLKQKAIPFVFVSTSGASEIVKIAYTATIQGFFKKETNFKEFTRQFKLIIEYWQCCLHPNK
ncbi:response regulator [Dyadobacter sp. 32]|uniref:response regulator n=1 Tax=Dyadobacter sp. 32 TaxID=538966 RepID=UPI0011EC0A91